MGGGETEGNLQRVRVLQKRAVRILDNLKSRDICREVFRELKIRTVTNLYSPEEMTFVQIKEPDSARSWLQYHVYNNTRNANN